MEIDPNVVIDRLGGTSAAARICDIEPASVSGWKKNGIPKPWVKFLRLAYPEAFLPVISAPKRDTSTATTE
jgi:hypothetical protein